MPALDHTMFHVEPHTSACLEVRPYGDVWRFETWDWAGEVIATGERGTYWAALTEARRWT